MSEPRRQDIRNIAIIAHVDHGKTTLVDELLKQSGTFRSNQTVSERIMDSNDQEKERGITILAKNTSVKYKNTLINIIDTPGHADFGGEVERILKMVDGVCLLVDAFEGAMPQTKFVTRKALELGLKPIVVINKIDRDGARPAYVLDQVYDLFIELGANDEQIEFPVIYTSAKMGYAQLKADEKNPDNNMIPLFEMIVDHIPGPVSYPDEPLQVLVTNLDYSDYLGRLGVGRIRSGSMSEKMNVIAINKDGKSVKGKISKLYLTEGLKRVEVNKATAGDIVVWAGLEEMTIGDTICLPEHPKALERITIDEPTIVMNFMVNDSPFAGQDGTYVTSRNLRDRLYKEAMTNVALRVEETDSTDTFRVSGRGELHLSVLIENMRREGYEFQVSRPEVVIREIDGKKQEPIEELTLDVPEEYAGSVIEVLGRRKAEMTNMHTDFGTTRMTFIIPARGLIGLRGQFMTLTRGTGNMYSIFHDYADYKGEIPARQSGTLIAHENTETNPYAIFNLQERGRFFLGAGEKVYEGQIVGEHNRDNDLAVSIGKTKKLSNVRASGSDDALILTPPTRLSLEQSIDFINDDEWVEITPKQIRLRKRFLSENDRKRYSRKKLAS
ncbi:MAG: translational GTPase TypA [Calditrichaeota bacterium]|nr:translational GTPase TypA [Calditrichota bacterium]